MIKEKFEFQKLELPNKKWAIETLSDLLEDSNSEYSTQKESIFTKNIGSENESLPLFENNSISRSKILHSNALLISLILIIFLAISSFFYFNTEKKALQEVSLQKTIPIPSLPKPLKPDSITHSLAPKYFNYHDSIVFLNDVKGEKRVVSKGYDDYLKKDKIIIKSGDYYYNCFCTDLFENYKVGEIIP